MPPGRLKGEMFWADWGYAGETGTLKRVGKTSLSTGSAGGVGQGDEGWGGSLRFWNAHLAEGFSTFDPEVFSETQRNVTIKK